MLFANTVAGAVFAMNKSASEPTFTVITALALPPRPSLMV